MAKPGPKCKFKDRATLGMGGLYIERAHRDLIFALAEKLVISRCEVVRRLIAKGIQQLKKEAAK